MKKVKSLYKYTKTWRIRNLEKVKAHRAVFIEIRAKRLIPENCFCGNIGQAHHDDYSKPLQIKWFCKNHHVEEDRVRKKRLGQNYFNDFVFAERYIKERGLEWFKKNHNEIYKTYQQSLRTKVGGY